MFVFDKIKSLQQKIATMDAGSSVGFVPTMGALHKGHISLVKSAKKENDLVVVSIFVNPTQFDKKEDLVNYPKTLDRDLEMLEEAQSDFVFVPAPEEIYADNIRSEAFSFDGLEHEMEGKFRTGHFDGVGTVVKRLFQIVKPTRAYFGEKDFQQLQIIKKMVQQEDLNVEIVPCEIFREDDGLAMSSRNARLSETHRNAAPLIYKVLRKVQDDFNSKSIKTQKEEVSRIFDSESTLELEYFEIADEATLKPATEIMPDRNYRAFIAVFAGEVRLIDNIGL